MSEKSRIAAPTGHCGRHGRIRDVRCWPNDEMEEMMGLVAFAVTAQLASLPVFMMARRRNRADGLCNAHEPGPSAPRET